MKTITKQDWIDALRSGKYKQASGRLKGPDGFCCLGVACELAEIWPAKTLGNSEPLITSKLPKQVLDMLGGYTNAEYDQRIPVGAGEISTNALSNMNDVSRLTFMQLADVLEGKMIVPEEERI